MKIAKRRVYGPPKTSLTIIADEFHQFAAPGSPMRRLLDIGQQFRKPGARRIVATQAVMKFNSGKRVRFLGSMRYEDTGEAIKPTPTKFVPAQVARRARELALDELVTEAQKHGMYN